MRGRCRIRCKIDRYSTARSSAPAVSASAGRLHLAKFTRLQGDAGRPEMLLPLLSGRTAQQQHLDMVAHSGYGLNADHIVCLSQDLAPLKRIGETSAAPSANAAIDITG